MQNSYLTPYLYCIFSHTFLDLSTPKAKKDALFYCIFIQGRAGPQLGTQLGVAQMGLPNWAMTTLSYMSWARPGRPILSQNCHKIVTKLSHKKLDKFQFF